MKKEFRAVCPYDCADSCGLIIETNDGIITRVKGDPDHPHTQGFLCRKMQHYERDIYSPDRIMVPYKRVGKKGSRDSFVQVSWNEAVKDITDHWKEIIKSYGADSIIPYSFAGTMGLLHRTCGETFFNRMGGGILERNICGTGRTTAFNLVSGVHAGKAIQKIDDNDFILIYGDNPKSTRIHIVPFIKKASANGAKVVMVDIYQNISADLADEFISVKPGTDAALLLAMMHELDLSGLLDMEFIQNMATGFEELREEYMKWTPESASEICGVSPENIRKLALEYGSAKSPLILSGYGMSRYSNGGAACRLLECLPVLTGAWKRGGGTSGNIGASSYSNKNPIKRTDLAETMDRRKVSMTLLAKELLDPVNPIRSLYVYHSNPAVMAPDQNKVIEGLMREDMFLVVHDRFFTDTALYADYVLPATFSAEQSDIFDSFGSYHTQVGYQIIDPPGECRSNWDTFCALARGMGYEDDIFKKKDIEIIHELLDSNVIWGSYMREEDQERYKEGYPVMIMAPDPSELRTSDQKYHLYPAPMTYVPIDDQKYPLRLVLSHSPWSINSNFSYNDELMTARGGPVLRMNREDCIERELKDGDMAYAYNDLGKLLVKIEIAEGILPGTTNAEGVHQKNFCFNDHNFCCLVPAGVSNSGRGPVHNNSSIEVIKA